MFCSRTCLGERRSMPKRDYAAKKPHAYTVPRNQIRRDKLRREVIKKRIKITGLVISQIGLMVTIVYWVFFSSVFEINHLIVSDDIGEPHVQVRATVLEYLNQRSWLILPRKNYFIFNKSALMDDLRQFGEFNPPIYDIEIEQKRPKMLIVRFKRRVAYVFITVIKREPAPDYTETAVGYFLIDSHGYAVEQWREEDRPGVDQLTLPIVRLITASQIKPGQKVLSAELIDQIVYIDDLFKRYMMPRIEYFEIDFDHINAITVNTPNYNVYFSLDYSLQNQADNLLLSLEKIGDQSNKLVYIDLRIQNRAYVCCDFEKF